VTYFITALLHRIFRSHPLKRVTFRTQSFNSKKSRLHSISLTTPLIPSSSHTSHFICELVYGCSSSVPPPVIPEAFPLPVAPSPPIAATTFFHKPCNQSHLTSAKPSHAIELSVEFKTEERMGKLLRAEPEGPKYLEGYPQAKDLLKKAKWLRFIQKFKAITRR
jgi:hypothetical protein